MSQTKITTDNINTLDAAMLTGSALPALNGAALTNVPGVTNSASDPAINTNPSGGVGTAWLNTTTGNLYCCTDATAGANVWTNVGRGSGDVKLLWTEIGTVAGYMMAGTNPDNNIIDKFPFASNTTATDHGDLTTTKREFDGCSSDTDGYGCGGESIDTGGPLNIVDKFPFASNSGATDFGDLTQSRYATATCSSNTHGYVAQGHHLSPHNIIDRFTFGSNNNSVDVGDLTQAKYGAAGCSSETHGFISGGINLTNVINKFSFAASSNGVDHGDMRAATSYPMAHSSETHGYLSGGYNPNVTNVIDKFAYASNTTAAGHGTLAINHYGGGCSQTNETAYIGGGIDAGGPTASIKTFSFASSGQNSTHGNLSAARRKGAGTND